LQVLGADTSKEDGVHSSGSGESEEEDLDEYESDGFIVDDEDYEEEGEELHSEE
jgi:hypothetical protein